MRCPAFCFFLASAAAILPHNAILILVDEENHAINLEGERVEEGQNVFKAMKLSGREYRLFIRDSRTGQILCKPNRKIIELNKSLHAN